MSSLSSDSPIARRGDGQSLNPGDGVVPILKEIRKGHLSVIGTGFYVTRYGLFVTTAKHVIEDLADYDRGLLTESMVCHLGPDDTIYFRRLRKAHLSESIDIAVVQADNYIVTFPTNPLQNLRACLSTIIPEEGSPLITYGYPENLPLDFAMEDQIPLIQGDYFQGGFLRYVQQSEHPFLPYPHFETSVELRPGTSGGPVFDSQGHVIGVNCRGWDFRGEEHEGDNLSYIVPIENILNLDIDPFMIPPQSWEAQQIPISRRGKTLSGRELAQYGHYNFFPSI